MSKTAVGLFRNSSVADQVVHDLGTSAFPQNKIRVLAEPPDMPVEGMMSTPHTDFEVGLDRELKAIGASEREVKAYVQGVRRGGVLVFATGSNQEVDGAAEIMNRNGAIDVEELAVGEPATGSMLGEDVDPLPESSVQTGRIRQPGAGVQMFVW